MDCSGILAVEGDLICPGVKADRGNIFPPGKLVIASAMLWSTPQSARFRPGYRSPDYSGSGFYENAPLIPPDGDTLLNSDEPSFPKAFFTDLQESGIDAIDHCFFDNYPVEVLRATADAARDSGTGIKVFPMMDRMPKRGLGFLAEVWEDARLREHPNLLRAGDYIVVFSFDVHGAEVWRARLDKARAVGGKFFIVSDTMIFGGPVPPERIEELRRELESTDGLFNFLDVSHPETGVLPELVKLANSFQPRKCVGGCVAPGYIGSTRQGIIHDLRGTEHFRQRWLDCIGNDLDFVYLTTLNDYTESTEQECSANSTFTFLDMNAYFGSKWKKGVWPQLPEPRAFLSYRKAVAKSEPVEVELVLLRPDIRGNEDVSQIAARFHVELNFEVNGHGVVAADLVQPNVMPGHLVWRYWLNPGMLEEGFATPAVKMFENGMDISLQKGKAAPFAVVGNGEQVARHWLHVPLHRICPEIISKVVVTGKDSANTYPRRISLEGIPWEKVSCIVLERDANPLSQALTPRHLQSGFAEEFYEGPGWCPMSYKNGSLKRNIIDKADRYTAVVRMKDNTFVYPTPALVSPPRLLKNEPYVDPATVMDIIIAPGEILFDRGWMRRELPLPVEISQRPTFHKKVTGEWFMRFDGVANAVKMGPISMPPGPATLELLLSPHDISRTQTIFDSSEPILSLVLMAGGRLRLLRFNQRRQEVTIESSLRLTINEWHHIVAVFTGAEIRLHIDGKLDGMAKVNGLRSDKESSIGSPAIWSSGIRAESHFAGDLAALRILQRFMSDEEIASLNQNLN